MANSAYEILISKKKKKCLIGIKFTEIVVRKKPSELDRVEIKWLSGEDIKINLALVNIKLFRPEY